MLHVLIITSEMHSIAGASMSEFRHVHGKIHRPREVYKSPGTGVSYVLTCVKLCKYVLYLSQCYMC